MATKYDELFDKINAELTKRRQLLTDKFQEMNAGDQELQRKVSWIALCLADQKKQIRTTLNSDVSKSTIAHVETDDPELTGPKDNENNREEVKDTRENLCSHGDDYKQMNGQTKRDEQETIRMDRDGVAQGGYDQTGRKDKSLAFGDRSGIKATGDVTWRKKRSLQTSMANSRTEHVDRKEQPPGTISNNGNKHGIWNVCGKAQEIHVNHGAASGTAFAVDVMREVQSQPLRAVKGKCNGQMEERVLRMIAEKREEADYMTRGANWEAAVKIASVFDETVSVSVTSPDTLLCLDTGLGADVKRARGIALSFVNGIEAVSKSSGLEENICVMSLGKPEMIHQLSNDYNSIRKSIESMACFGGNDPPVKSLFTCLAALSCCSPCRFDGGFTIAPRVIVVTNGFDPSPFSNTVECTNFFLMSMASIGKYFVNPPVDVPMFVCPLEHNRKRILQEAIGESKGIVVDDISSLCFHNRTRRFCAQIVRNLAEKYSVWNERMKRALSLEDSLTVDMAEQEKNFVVDELMRHYTSEEAFSAATDVTDNVVPVTPSSGVPLGTRVVPGPDIKGLENVKNWIGTVVNSGINTGTVFVHWDHGDCRLYNYGYSDLYDVLIAENQSRDPLPNGDIAIGMQVERGPDWRHSKYFSYEKLGKYGTVVRKWKDLVTVAWKDQIVVGHWYGFDGFFHVVIRSANHGDSEEWDDVHRALEESCY